MTTQEYPVYCSWCNEVYKYKDTPNSHGICPKCYIKVLAQNEKDQKELNKCKNT